MVGVYGRFDVLLSRTVRRLLPGFHELGPMNISMPIAFGRAAEHSNGLPMNI
jgi:hypothetical protein